MNPHVLLKDQASIEAAESIQRLDEAGRLYHMTVKSNYYDIPEEFKPLFNAGCSVFVTKNLEGEILFCRSYDYRHYKDNDKKNNGLTGLNVVVHSANPAARFKSVGVADAFWLDHRQGRYAEGCMDDGVTDVSPFVMVPHITMDAMNEKGLCTCILALCVENDWNEIEYAKVDELLDPDKQNFELEEPGQLPDRLETKTDIGSIAVNKADQKAWVCSKRHIMSTDPGKKTVLHTTLMRVILDNCSTVDEALNLASTMNVVAPAPGMDFHIMFADATGKARMIEWLDGKMQVVDNNFATNFFLSREDRFGAGYERYECIKAGLYRCEKGGMREDFAENLMKIVTMDPTNGNDTSKTQWTSIYNLTKKTLKVFAWGDFSRSWEFGVTE